MTTSLLERLDAVIAELEQELAPGLKRLSELKRKRRPLAAAAASAKKKAEKNSKRDQAIVTTYGPSHDRLYGSRLEIARQHRLSVRTIGRIIQK